MTTKVAVFGLGPVVDRVELDAVAGEMNEAQDEYYFYLEDSLVNMPKPTKPRADRYDSPQYEADKVFEYIEQHRNSNEYDIKIGVIDSEVYDELYSTTDRKNNIILVSVRVSDLAATLEHACKTFEQYVQVEVGAQLLALQYRRRADIHPAPEECAQPWHEERRNCLFDYFGISPDNVTKLIEPQLSTESLVELRQMEVPQRLIDASLNIVKEASSTKWFEVGKRAMSDGLVTLSAGFLLGLCGSILANQDGYLALFFGVMAMLIIGLRIAYWKLT